MLFTSLVGQAFPKGLRTAVYFGLAQSASKDFCIGPCLSEPGAGSDRVCVGPATIHRLRGLRRGKHSMGKVFLEQPNCGRRSSLPGCLASKNHYPTSAKVGTVAYARANSRHCKKSFLTILLVAAIIPPLQISRVCSRRTSNTTLEGSSDRFFQGRVVSG